MYNSKIEWTEATWNPLRGCARVSEGCRFCYAERVADRFSGTGQPYEGLTTRGKDGQPRWNNEIMLVPHMLKKPLSWKQPRRIFVNSMSDLFHEKVPFDYIQQVFDVMRQASWHEFQILTKRAERLAELAPQIDWSPNVWMGVSIEDSRVIDRADALREVPATIRFLSLEPLIGSIPNLNLKGLDWAIIGGESGNEARIMEPEWAVDLLNQCRSANVPCFIKQMGTQWAKRQGSKSRKGDDFSEFPEALQVREYPRNEMALMDI